MASGSAPLQEWLVIVPDHEGALQKRIAVRQDHLGGLKKDDESFWLWGGTFASFAYLTRECAGVIRGACMFVGFRGVSL